MKTQIIAAAFAALAFFGMVSCAGPSEGASDEQQTIGIVAHRGYWNCEEAGYARNSIASLRCAQEYGFWGSEFDLHLTTDEVILVVHDDVVGGKRIDENPYSEFADMTLENGEKIPTLDDYLTQGAKSIRTKLVCEFKIHRTPELEDRLMELTFAKLKEYGLYDPKRIMFVTFSRHILEYIAKEMPEFDVECVGNEYDPDDLYSINVTGVNYEFHTFDNNPTWYDMVRANGMRLKVWNPNTVEDMKWMIGIEPDVISTDQPLLLRNVFNEVGVEEL